MRNFPCHKKKEMNTAHADQNHLLQVAVSLLPPSVEPDHGTARSIGALELIAVVANAAGLFL